MVARLRRPRYEYKARSLVYDLDEDFSEELAAVRDRRELLGEASELPAKLVTELLLGSAQNGMVDRSATILQ